MWHTIVILLMVSVAVGPAFSQDPAVRIAATDAGENLMAIPAAARTIKIPIIADYAIQPIDPFGVAQPAKRPRPGITGKGKLMILGGVLAIGAGALMLAMDLKTQGSPRDYDPNNNPSACGGALTGAGIGLIWRGWKEREETGVTPNK
jgi:hypothetical protein